MGVGLVHVGGSCKVHGADSFAPQTLGAQSVCFLNTPHHMHRRLLHKLHALVTTAFNIGGAGAPVVAWHLKHDGLILFWWTLVCKVGAPAQHPTPAILHSAVSPALCLRLISPKLNPATEMSTIWRPNNPSSMPHLTCCAMPIPLRCS